MLITVVMLSIALAAEAAPLDPALTSMDEAEADEMLWVVPKTMSGSLVKLSTSLPPMDSGTLEGQGAVTSSPLGAIQELPHTIHPLLLQLDGTTTTTSAKLKRKMNSDNMHG
jgi:hypothetical protein